MVMSRERRCKFQNFLLFAISKFNISTCHKISSEKDLYFRSYLQKHQGGGGGEWKTPPVPLELIFCNVSAKWAIYFKHA